MDLQLGAIKIIQLNKKTQEKLESQQKVLDGFLGQLEINKTSQNLVNSSSSSAYTSTYVMSKEQYDSSLL